MRHSPTTGLWHEMQELALALPTNHQDSRLYVKCVYPVVYNEISSSPGEIEPVLGADVEWRSNYRRAKVQFSALSVSDNAGNLGTLFEGIKETMGYKTQYPYPDGPVVDSLPLESPDTKRQAEFAKLILDAQPSLTSLQLTIPELDGWSRTYCLGRKETDTQALVHLRQANQYLAKLGCGETVFYAPQEVSTPKVESPSFGWLYGQPNL